MRIILAFGLLAFALTAAAQLYRWTDENGKVNYTDTPPPANARNVQKKGAARPGGGEAAPAAAQSYAMQLAAKNFPITIYTSKDCGNPCQKGLDFLKKRAVPFTEKVVTTQAEVDAVVKLAGAPRVPVLAVGIVVQKDFEEQAWGEALDTAGYPKTATP